MPNPTTVSTLTKMLTSWGNAVVSRVVGIYASIAAAEADGRTDDGALVSVDDTPAGELLTRYDGDWYRVHPTLKTINVAGYTHVQTASIVFQGGAAFADDHNGAPIDVQGSVTLTVECLVATRVSLALDISQNAGASWSLGNWYDTNVAANWRQSLTAKHFREGITATGDLWYRLRTKLDVLASVGDAQFIGDDAALSFVVAPFLKGRV